MLAGNGCKLGEDFEVAGWYQGAACMLQHKQGGSCETRHTYGHSPKKLYGGSLNKWMRVFTTMELTQDEPSSVVQSEPREGHGEA